MEQFFPAGEAGKAGETGEAGEAGTAVHGGDIYRNHVRLDFSVNVNPAGPPSAAVSAYRKAAPGWLYRRSGSGPW